jgi:small nuclear ribonucleoprotein (snRNP)-like protein
VEKQGFGGELMSGNFNDPLFAKDLIDELKRIILKELRTELRFDKTYVAKVVAVSGGYANIQLEESTNTISNVKNKSGEVLVPDDYVYVEAINNSLNNIVIKYKK